MNLLKKDYSRKHAIASPAQEFGSNEVMIQKGEIKRTKLFPVRFFLRDKGFAFIFRFSSVAIWLTHFISIFVRSEMMVTNHMEKRNSEWKKEIRNYYNRNSELL